MCRPCHLLILSVLVVMLMMKTQGEDLKEHLGTRARVLERRDLPLHR